MATLIVPPPDDKPWPTLGPDICAWIEANLVYGPGDLRGQPYKIEDEFEALLYRMYEVVPKGRPGAGRRRFNRAAINVRKGTAKALALDTPIATPSGWTTMGDIQVGDVVFDEAGQPTTVVDASEVFTGHDCFELVFRDGQRIIADAGHRWYTEALRDPRATRYGGSVKTTEEIAATVSTRADGASNHRIPVAGPLNLPEAALPIDPWVLGAWLGDGRTNDCEFTMHINDHPEFCQSAEAAGYRVGDFKPDSRRPSTGSVRVFGLRSELRAAGLLGDKRVPAVYLRGSRDQRLALLQGLMDTDGTCAKVGGGSSFTSTLLVLAEAVYELACSLGLKPSLRTTKSPGAPAWKVNFHAHRNIPVFRLKRKVDLLPERPDRMPMSRNRHIVSCERVPSVPTRCIAVDSDSHLFLAGEAMVPTHNTEKAAIIAACELHPDAPVRCDGWDANGEPVGRGVRDPYVALVAYTQEQTEELGFNVLRTILSEGQLADDFDIGLERILVLDSRGRAAGKAVPLTGAPGARDGARTTFQTFDEPLALETEVPTLRGWTTIGDIREGDFVFGRDGRPVRVVGKSPVHEGRMCYRVTFRDGSSVVTDGKHRWKAVDWSNRPRGEHVFTTQEMFDRGVETSYGFRWRLPRGNGIDGAHAELPIDPYLLGMWLGDGSTDAGYIHSHETDYPAMSDTYSHTVANDHGNTLVRWLPTGLRRELRLSGLLGNKHVPDVYLTASREQRVALLRGLMDTDGHTTKLGNCTFVQKHESLVQEVASLVRSLGVPASVTSQVDERSRTGMMWKCHFSPDFDPFALFRRSSRSEWPERGNHWWPAIVSIEPVDSVPVQCIAVDSDDHLFVFGRSFHLTHNTHRMTRPMLMKAHTTMLQNTYKRQMADAWTLETTTFHDPTEQSVAADTFAYAQAVNLGEVADPRLMYFYRYAPEEMPMGTREDVKAALLEASGPAASWSADLNGLVEHWFEPKTDKNYYRRVWLNQRVAGTGKAFDSVKWAEAVDTTHVVADRSKIAIGFDGAKNRDGTALVACELKSGFMWLAGYWQAPDNDPEWEVDPVMVTQVVAELFDRYKVERMYADPFYWTTEVDGWRGRWGDRKVISYATTLYKRVGMACSSFAQSISNGQIPHGGDSKFAEHIANSVKMDLNLRGDDDVPLWTITKERRGSPLKIDAAMAAVLAWQARNDSIAAGALKRGTGRVASFN